MRGQGNLVRRIGRRFFCGFFCISLFFSDAAPIGLTAWASESASEQEAALLKRNEIPAPGTGEGEAGGETLPENPDGGEAGGKTSSEDPGEGEEGGETPSENPDGGEAGGKTPSENPGEGEEGGEPPVETLVEDSPGVSENDPEGSVSGNSPEESVSENTLTEDSVMSLAAAGSIASGVNENGKVVWVIDAGGKLTVQGEGEIDRDYSNSYYGRMPWDSYSEQITSAKIDLKSTMDLSMLFYGCKNLKTVDVSGMDTSAAADMSDMFGACLELTALDVSGFDTSNVTDMRGMFYGCVKLTALDVSGFDTSNVTDMSRMFYGCNSVTELDVSHFDTGKVTAMHNMFRDCLELTELDVSGFDTKNVTSIFGMFYCCVKLTALDVSHFDTGKVIDMSEMFGSCESLTALDVSGFDTKNVTSMRSMFSECANLTALDLSSFDTAKVTDMSGMFWYCEGLTELDVRGFDTSSVADMATMFVGCKGLTELDLSGFDTAKVTSMRMMFSDCQSLPELDLSNFDTSKVTDMYCMFSRCYGLTELDLSGFHTTGVTDMERMFDHCQSLAKLDLSGFDTSSVTNMESLFAFCSSLTSLDLSSFDIGHLTQTSYIQNLLLECKSLERIYTPKNVQAHLTFPKAAAGDVWYGRIDGEVMALDEAKENLQYSVLMVKNNKDVQVEEKLTATKGKTVYLCGEPILVNDLRVTYYVASGAIRKLTAEEYNTNAGGIDTTTPGEKELKITYTPEGKAPLSATVLLRVTEALTADNTVITMPEETHVYTGDPITPKPVVTYHGTTLTEGADYTVGYRNHVNACPDVSDGTAKGKQPTVIVNGTGNYSGKLTAVFPIAKAAAPPAEILEEKAVDCETAQSGRKLVLSAAFPACGKKTGCHITEVREDDTIPGAVFAREPLDADIKNGVFTYDTGAGTNGDFATVMMTVSFSNYEDAALSVRITLQEETVMYTVTLDWMGHGNGRSALSVRAGSLLELTEEEKTPETVVEAGGQYLFAGWYRDKAFVKGKEWNFASDTVQEAMTLYACWLHDPSGGKLKMYIQDIEDLTYTGSALKPTVIVYDSDGTTVLKAGRDYTVKYYNNTNAGGSAESGAVAKVENLGKKGQEKFTPAVPGRGDGNNAEKPEFDSAKPYIAVTGRGNYEETVCKNFCIRPAQIAGEDGAPAFGVTLRYADQLTVNAKKEQKPFQSLTYKRAMKAGMDFTVTLGVEGAGNAADGEGRPLAANWKAEGNTENRQIPAIPKGYSGSFLLTVKGTGNYTGWIRENVFVADSVRLMKNAKITLGRNQKSKAYQNGDAVILRAGFYEEKTKKNYEAMADGTLSNTPESNANDIFTVKLGKEFLIRGRDFSVSYRDNTAVGTATMVLTGMGAYTGTKSITFKITGERFAANTVDVKVYDAEKPELPQPDAFRSTMPYTGRAVLQNKVLLTTKVTRSSPKAKTLVYGEHYTIRYKNNVKKGTATMTFTARPESGFSGSFSKTFKIGVVNIADKNAVKFSVSPTGQTGEPRTLEEKIDEKGNSYYQLKGRVDYSREGAKPLSYIAISLMGEKGRSTALKEGTDYTVSYANNTIRQADEAAKRKQPVMTVRGKGNYTGSVKIVFSISDVAIKDNPNLTVTASPTAFDAKKKEDYTYQPKITVKDGKRALGRQDYAVTYHNNTQTAVRAWLDALGDGTARETVYGMRPYAEIAAAAGSGYDPEGGKIVLDLPVYEKKLAANTLYVVVDEEHAVYTGRQLTPSVTVYYGEAAAVREAKAEKETDAAKLTKPTAQGGFYGLTALTEKKGAAEGDYIRGYGANTVAGKNKGSVTLTGTERYGGSVTVRFEIRKKAMIDV